MTHWRQILHCLLTFVLAAVPAAGTAAAENEMPVACDQITIVASASANVSHGVSDNEQTAGASNVIRVEPAGRGCDAIVSTAHIDRDLESALIDNEGLRRVSGGATLFATPDVVSQRLFAIILWDEGKSKRSTSYEQGPGLICSTISVQGR